MFAHHARVGALFLWLAPIAIARGQDSPRLARALERAEQFDLGLGASPRPTAQWLPGDRLAWSVTGGAPWTIVDAPTGRVLQSEAGSETMPAQGPPADLVPSWMV